MRSASIGIHEVVETDESLTSVAVTSMYPSSSPRASEGSDAMNEKSTGDDGTNSMFCSTVPTCGSTTQSSGRLDVSYEMFQFAVREPIAVMLTSTNSDVPGSILETNSGP